MHDPHVFCEWRTLAKRIRNFALFAAKNLRVGTSLSLPGGSGQLSRRTASEPVNSSTNIQRPRRNRLPRAFCRPAPVQEWTSEGKKGTTSSEGAFQAIRKSIITRINLAIDLVQCRSEQQKVTDPGNWRSRGLVLVCSEDQRCGGDRIGKAEEALM